MRAVFFRAYLLDREYKTFPSRHPGVGVTLLAV